MDIATDTSARLEVRRVYPHPVAAVYAACTDPAQIARWMGPSDAFGVTEVTLDLRVGGRFRFVMHAPAITRAGSVA